MKLNVLNTNRWDRTMSITLLEDDIGTMLSTVFDEAAETVYVVNPSKAAM